MTIDIILFCYKQEQYIRQAVESILLQEYPDRAQVRIVVADDASPDNTLLIIHEILDSIDAKMFSVLYLPIEPNMGISKNYKRSFAATQAEYVFIIEGDDYWLPGHVTQHIAFMTSHADCSLSMNNVNVLEEASNELMEYTYWPYAENFIYADVRKQIEEGNQLGNLSGCMVRGQYLRELPTSLFELPIADWMLGVMFSQRGFLAILKTPTSVYRIKTSGVWAGKGLWTQLTTKLHYSHIYDRFQNYKYHNMWQTFRKNLISDACRHWMKFLPIGLQKGWHTVKKKCERCE